MDGAAGYSDYRFVAELYDHVAPYAARGDIDFWVEQALAARGPVLEIGCGTGRVLLPTARAGVSITGLDLSPHMLTVCRAQLSKEPQEIRDRAELIEADMRSFDLGRTFALATMPFRPFQHLTTVDDQMACLATIRRHLHEGGRLILDLFNPSIPILAREDEGQEHGPDPEFSTPDGRKVVSYDRYVERDLHHQIIRVELIYYVTHPDGREERLVHAFPMRYLFRYEAEHLLARCGYQVEHLYSDYAKSPYGASYPGELIFVARAV